MKQTEIELKYALTEAEYRRLRRRFPQAPTLRFTNYFFDTPKGTLRQHGIGCRIRWIPGRAAILTVKHGGGSRGGLHRRIEVEVSVPPKKAKALLSKKGKLASLAPTEPVRALLKLVGESTVEKLILLGGLQTARTKIRFQGLTGELDRCRVAGSYFHELEVESDRPRTADRKSRQWLETFKIPARPETQTKLGRFFASLGV